VRSHIYNTRVLQRKPWFQRGFSFDPAVCSEERVLLSRPGVHGWMTRSCARYLNLVRPYLSHAIDAYSCRLRIHRVASFNREFVFRRTLRSTHDVEYMYYIFSVFFFDKKTKILKIHIFWIRETLEKRSRNGSWTRVLYGTGYSPSGKNFLSTGPETRRKRSVCSRASKCTIEWVPYLIFDKVMGIWKSPVCMRNIWSEVA
jgi:hypothetical protein